MSVCPMSQAKFKSTFQRILSLLVARFSYTTWHLCHLYRDKCHFSGLGQYIGVQGHYIIRYAVSFVSLFRTKCV